VYPGNYLTGNCGDDVTRGALSTQR
jgi:hypothetical protein